jgi:hemerythrin-like metal-binding protein
MTFEWSPQLAVGAEVIDAQHRELFHRVDRFVRALTEHAPAAETMHLLGFLGEYVVTHFADEEALPRRGRTHGRARSLHGDVSAAAERVRALGGDADARGGGRARGVPLALRARRRYRSHTG